MKTVILNEKDLRDAKARVIRFNEALSSRQALEQVLNGLPHEVIEQVSRQMKLERIELEEAVEAYENAKNTGDAKKLQERAGSDPGLTLIVARIAKGFSQKDLAWRLGVKEQQVQRSEADRYASISLKNYRRIAILLGVKLEATIHKVPEFRGLNEVIANVSKSDIAKILKHGRAHDWFDEQTTATDLQRMIAENRIQFGSPSLLRTGLNVVDHSEDFLLDAWRTRVTYSATKLIPSLSKKYDPFSVDWLPNLVPLSQADDGPKRARDFLREFGILLIAESQIPGLAIDGASFLIDETPVVGMTLRRDSIDNFWFTLMHEIGHIVLHYRSGLSSGFFDEIDADSIDEQEAEADRFASNMLIPNEQWRRSTARIAKSPEIITTFANKLGIHPAIVVGRIRKERRDYSIFSKELGTGTVRKQLLGQPK